MTKPRVEWVGHEDGSTAFMIIIPHGTWERINYEGGMWWDVIVKDWEQVR